jgi:hypothetical protein
MNSSLSPYTVLINDIDHSETIDIAFIPTINEWNGTRSVQLNIKALRFGQ